MPATLIRELAHPERWFPELEPGRWWYSRVAAEILSDWNRVFHVIQDEDDLASLQATRDAYYHYLLAVLQVLDGYLGLARVSEQGDPKTDQLTQLIDARAKLRNHFDSLFPEWQNQQDLQRILLRSRSLPNSRLIAMASKSPEQSWFEETENPFLPEP